MMKNFSSSSFVAGVILGALIAGVWVLGKTSDIPLPPAEHTPTNQSSASTESGTLSVVDQPAGAEVAVESVTVPPPGVWVAVRETNGVDLANVLGAIRVAGPRTNVSVSLLRATEPGRTYVVQLYRDDNGGAFDPAVNSVYVDFDTGARVVVPFKTAN